MNCKCWEEMLLSAWWHCCCGILYLCQWLVLYMRVLCNAGAMRRITECCFYCDGRTNGDEVTNWSAIYRMERCVVVLWKWSVAGRKEGINARKSKTFCHFSLRATAFFKFNEETRCWYTVGDECLRPRVSAKESEKRPGLFSKCDQVDDQSQMLVANIKMKKRASHSHLMSQFILMRRGK